MAELSEDDAFKRYQIARCQLVNALNEGYAATVREYVREYYRSKVRFIDEADIERVHSVAQAIDRFRKTGKTPTQEDLAKWSQKLWNFYAPKQ